MESSHFDATKQTKRTKHWVTGVKPSLDFGSLTTKSASQLHLIVSSRKIPLDWHLPRTNTFALELQSQILSLKTFLPFYRHFFLEIGESKSSLPSPPLNNLVTLSRLPIGNNNEAVFCWERGEWLGADFDCTKVCHLTGLCHSWQAHFRELKGVFERHTTTGSDVFFILVHLGATKFAFLSVLLPSRRWIVNFLVTLY